MKLRQVLWVVLLSVALLAAVSAAGAAVSSGYTLAWYTVDGGGGASSGAGYSLSGTIGQPDAGTLSGAGYTLQGGFWGAEQSASPYKLYLPVVQR